MLPFSLKGSQQVNSLQVPHRGPYGETYPLTGHFYLSLNIFFFIFTSETSVRKPPPCSLTGYPWAAILHHQSHWSTFHSFIHLCMSAGVPKKEPSYIHTYGEKHKFTIHGAPRRQKTYRQWDAAWFPKGIVNDTAISTPVPCGLRHDTFHLGLGRPEHC